MKRHPFVRGSRLSDALERVLQRVLRKQKLARHGLEIEPVHDLRVALRRCRSLAEGFSEMDPHLVWRDLRKACRKQQRGLAELRDTQVMAEWIRRLGLARGPAQKSEGAVLGTALEREERRGRRKAKASLKSFSRKRWKRWSRTVPAYAGGLSVGESRLARIAFERVTDLCALERDWRRNRSAVQWHRLRIAAKRFRYALESFLPTQHAAWGRDLKRLQTRLGEGHDLDVLRAWILRLAREESLPRPVRKEWLRRIAQTRQEKTSRYIRAVSRARPGGRARSGLVYDRWREELERLAKVNPANAAGPARSVANRGWPAMGKNP